MRTRILFVSIAVLVAAALVDQRVPDRVPQASGTVPTAPSGGVLACPIATTGRADAYLYVANVGEEPARARIFLRSESKKATVERVGLQPGKIETLALHTLVSEPAGVVIEWSGGRVVAAHTLHSKQVFLAPGSRLPRFFSGAQCSEPQGPELAIVGARTNAVGDTTLSLFNPGPAPAVVTVAVRNQGEYMEFERLQRRIVQPLTRKDFSLRRFAGGRDEVPIVIRMDQGRVVAEALIETRQGAELLPGVPPLTDALAIAGQSGGATRLSLAPTERTLIGEGGEGIELPVEMVAARYDGGVIEAPAEIPTALGRDVGISIGIPGDGQPVAYAFAPLSGRIAAGVSWPLSGEGVFDLIAAPAMQPATTIFGIVPTYGPAWQTDLLVAAAGGEEATATLRVIGTGGNTRDVDIPPGSVARVPLAGGSGVRALVLTSEVPIAASVFARSGAIGYGTTLSSLRAATETAVRANPDIGIGARVR